MIQEKVVLNLKKMKTKKIIVLAVIASIGLGLFLCLKSFSYVSIKDYNVKEIEQYYDRYIIEYDLFIENNSEHLYTKNEFISLKYFEYLKTLKMNEVDLNYVKYEGANPNTSKISVSNPKDSTSITHALIHLAQHKDNPLLFNLKYNYFRKTKGHWDNPYEKEAYLNQVNSHYLKTRPKNAHKNYK